MSDDTRAYPRDHYEATLDVRYGIRFNELNERFFRRVRGVFVFATLLVGSSAFGGFLFGRATLVAIAGLAITILTLLDVVINPAEKIARFNEMYRRYTALDARAPELELATLDRELRAIRGEAPQGIEALTEKAYNDNLIANGRPDYAMPTTRWGRVVAWLS